MREGCCWHNCSSLALAFSSSLQLSLSLSQNAKLKKSISFTGKVLFLTLAILLWQNYIFYSSDEVLDRLLMHLKSRVISLIDWTKQNNSVSNLYRYFLLCFYFVQKTTDIIALPPAGNTLTTTKFNGLVVAWTKLKCYLCIFSKNKYCSFNLKIFGRDVKWMQMLKVFTFKCKTLKILLCKDIFLALL